MAKGLYRAKHIREIELKDGTLLRYKGYRDNLQYGEFEKNEFESSDWKDLLNELNYIDEFDEFDEFDGNKDRKKRLWVRIGYYDEKDNWREKRLYKDDFARVRTWLEKIEVNENYLKMKDLVNELKLSEFVDFLKDNEIKYVGNL